MLISRDDLRFWDVRTRERRLRRGEVVMTEIFARLDSLPDATDKATLSSPLEEPDERANERRAVPYVRVTMPPPRDDSDLDDLDDLDDDDDDEDDDDDDDLPLK